MKLDLYVTQGSERCRELAAVLEGARAELGLELREVDVAGDPAVAARYRDRVPVLLVEGRPLPPRDAVPSRVLRALRRRAEREGRPAGRGAARPRLSGVALAVLAALVAAGLIGAKVYEIAFAPRQQTRAYLGVEPRSGAAPAFELKAKDGSPVRLADYRGRTVFLNFWATWCDTCRVEMPSMQHLAQVLKGADFAMVAASVDDSWDPINQYFASAAPAFQVLHDPEARWSRTYGTVKFPETYLIGPDGKLIAKFTGPRDWADPAMEVYFKDLLASLGGRPASGAQGRP
jgi:thiol-disulfide isomerase/thioredoxin